MSIHHQESVLREIEEALASLKQSDDFLTRQKVERLELERHWLLSHVQKAFLGWRPELTSRDGTESSANQGNAPRPGKL